MAANNTPLHDLVELSGISAFTTFTTAAGGPGDILGFVDSATYTDGDGSNSATEITELNDRDDSNAGTLLIDGVTYEFELIVPDGGSHPVTVTYDNGASSVNLEGDGFRTEIAFIMAIPVGGGATRYFAAIDDSFGDLPNITSIQTRGLDFDPAGDDVYIDLDQNNNVTVCFASGTLIETDRGFTAVEDLVVGDRILTLDHGPLPLRWVHGTRYDLSKDRASNRRRPVRIKRGALGLGMPLRDLVVSPQHRLLLNSKVVARMFATPEILVPARKLVGLPGITRDDETDHVTYWHFFLGAHQIVFADGAAAESLLLEHQALLGFPETAQRELRALGERHTLPARPIVDNAQLVREMLRRHRKNAKPLCQPWTKARAQGAALRLVQTA